MMTPREILLEAHRAAGPQLDRVREEVLAAEFAPRPVARPVASRGFATAIAFKVWGELIWPSRRVWAGLAAVWVVLGVIYLADRNGGGFSGISFSQPQVRRFAAWGEQQYLLTLTFANPPPAEEATPEPAPLPEKSAEGAPAGIHRWASVKTVHEQIIRA